MIALGALYGIGYGLYLAVDWALACDTIPDRAKAAKDMGLFHVAQTLPNSVIPVIEGSLIDDFNRHIGRIPVTESRSAASSSSFFWGRSLCRGSARSASVRDSRAGRRP